MEDTGSFRAGWKLPKFLVASRESAFKDSSSGTTQPSKRLLLGRPAKRPTGESHQPPVSKSWTVYKSNSHGELRRGCRQSVLTCTNSYGTSGPKPHQCGLLHDFSRGHIGECIAKLREREIKGANPKQSLAQRGFSANAIFSERSIAVTM